jgi:hypothetical protein
MQVDVKLHGATRPRDGSNAAGRPFRIDLCDGVSARDLLRALADRCGDPFRRALGVTDTRLPRHIRIFANGEMLVTLDQPLASSDEVDAGVTVVVLSPMMGG